jgi:hypothetical protein
MPRDQVEPPEAVALADFVFSGAMAPEKTKSAIGVGEISPASGQILQRKLQVISNS